MVKKLSDRVGILEDRMNKRSNENNNFALSIVQVNKTLGELTTAIERVHTRLDDGDITITIKNGGLEAKYKLQDLLQSIKDAPMNALTNSGRIAKSINEVVKFLGGFAAFVYVLQQFFFHTTK